MQSPTAQQQLHMDPQDIAVIPRVHAGSNVGNDWRDTSRLSRHEDDELAGYLFTQDYEVREGSD